MSKYAYIKAGLGTSVTDTTFTSLQAEAFGPGAANLNAANCYSSIDSARANANLSDNDFMVVSNASIESYAVATNIIFQDNVPVMSVSDADGSLFLEGASIEVTSGNLGLYSSHPDGGLAVADGLYFYAEDDILFQYGVKYQISNYYLETVAVADALLFYSDGVDINFNRGSIKFNDRSYISVANGSRVHFNNLSVIAPIQPDYLFKIGGNGGGNLIVENSDLSNITPNNVLLLQNVDYDDICNVEFNRVKIQAGIDLYSDTVRSNRYFNFYSSDTGAGYYHFNYSRREGDILENTSVYRVGGSYYDKDAPTASNFSAQIQPNANVLEYINPLEIKIADIELDLTVANTLTFHLGFGDDSAAITPFNNDEAWIKLFQNDGTDVALGVATETKPATITTTPTELIASTETWVNLTHLNTDKRQIAITTDIVAGMANGQITAYLCIAKYVSTLEIFCCADPVVT